MQTTSYAASKAVVIKGVITLLLLLFCNAVTSVPLVNKFLGLQNWQARFFISRLFYWVCLAFALYHCANREKQKLLLWPEETQPFWFYLVSGVAMYFVLNIGALIMYRLFLLLGISVTEPREKEMIAALRGRFGLVLLASITAGVVEELLFRGYLIPRLEYIFNNRYFAVIISSLLFGLFHFGYFSWFHIASTFFIGLMFALHYVKYRNIKFLIVFHFLWDLLILWIKVR